MSLTLPRRPTLVVASFLVFAAIVLLSDPLGKQLRGSMIASFAPVPCNNDGVKDWREECDGNDLHGCPDSGCTGYGCPIITCASCYCQYQYSSVGPSNVCGNGRITAGELCDDGNHTGGDGCSATCEFECSDSDGGDNSGMKGTALSSWTDSPLNTTSDLKMFYPLPFARREDHCGGLGLIEYYCTPRGSYPNAIAEKEVYCPFGCGDGKCLAEVKSSSSSKSSLISLSFKSSSSEAWASCPVGFLSTVALVGTWGDCVTYAWDPPPGCAVEYGSPGSGTSACHGDCVRCAASSSTWPAPTLVSCEEGFGSSFRCYGGAEWQSVGSPQPVAAATCAMEGGGYGFYCAPSDWDHSPPCNHNGVADIGEECDGSDRSRCPMGGCTPTGCPVSSCTSSCKCSMTSPASSASSSSAVWESCSSGYDCTAAIDGEGECLMYGWDPPTGCSAEFASAGCGTPTCSGDCVRCASSASSSSCAPIPTPPPGCELICAATGMGMGSCPLCAVDCPSSSSSSSSSSKSSSSSVGSANISLVVDGFNYPEDRSHIDVYANIYNEGPAKASGIVFTLPLPTSFSFDPSASTIGCIKTGANVQCTSTDTNAGAFKNWHLSLNRASPCAAGTFDIVSHVTTSTTDPDLSNNEVPDTIEVVCPSSSSSSSVVSSSSSKSSSSSSKSSSSSSAASSSSSVKFSSSSSVSSSSSSSVISSSSSSKSSSSSSSPLLAPSANLYVTSLAARPSQLLGSRLSDTTLTIRLEAKGGDVDLRSINLAALWYDGTTLQPAHPAIGEIFLFQEWMGEELPLAIVPEGYCGSDDVAYCAELPVGALTISDGEAAIVSVRINAASDVAGPVNRTPFFLMLPANGVSASDAVTGAPLALNDAHAPARGEIFMFPREGGAKPDRQNFPLYGSAQYPLYAKILTVENATPSIASLGVGKVTLATLSVTAAPQTNSANGLNAAVLKGLIFNVTAKNISMDSSSFTLRTPGPNSPCTPLDDDGEAIVGSFSGSFIVSCPLLTQIQQDSTESFTLEARVLNPSINPALSSFLTVSLQHFSQRSYRSFGPVVSHLRWEDADATGSTPYFWIEHRTGVIEFLRFLSGVSAP